MIASQLKVKYLLEELGMTEKRIYLWEFLKSITREVCPSNFSKTRMSALSSEAKGVQTLLDGKLQQSFTFVIIFRRYLNCQNLKGQETLQRVIGKLAPWSRNKSDLWKACALVEKQKWSLSRVNSLTEDAWGICR